MTDRRNPPEPSMEEILASIRKIISDEGPKPTAAAQAGGTMTAERPQPVPPPARPAVVPPATAASLAASPTAASPTAAPTTAAPTTAAASVAGTVPPAEREDVLDLTEVVQANGAVVSIVRPTVAPERRASFTRPAERAVSERPAPVEQPAPIAPVVEATDDPLVSSAVAEAAIAAIARADASVAGTDPGVRIGSGDRTLEDVVRELLRPLLKEWLESKLPPLVEGIVREEIERVVRRSRLR